MWRPSSAQVQIGRMMMSARCYPHFAPSYARGRQWTSGSPCTSTEHRHKSAECCSRDGWGRAAAGGGRPCRSSPRRPFSPPPLRRWRSRRPTIITGTLAAFGVAALATTLVGLLSALGRPELGVAAGVRARRPGVRRPVRRGRGLRGEPGRGDGVAAGHARPPCPPRAHTRHDALDRMMRAGLLASTAAGTLLLATAFSSRSAERRAPYRDHSLAVPGIRTPIAPRTWSTTRRAGRRSKRSSPPPRMATTSVTSGSLPHSWETVPDHLGGELAAPEGCS